MKRYYFYFLIVLILSFLGCDMGGGYYPETTQQQKVSTPTISLESDFGIQGQKLVIDSSTNGVSIRYTTDGSTPTQSYGKIYFNGLSFLEEPSTVKAIAYKAGYQDSNIASRIFTKVIDPYPIISSDGGNITFISSGVDIYYSTLGIDPTSTSNKYFVQIPTSSITGNSLKVIATAHNKIKSDVVEVKKTTAPFFWNLSGGLYIMHNTLGVTLRYTTNGSTPSRTNGTLINNGGRINVTTGRTIKAIAYTYDSLNSDVATYYYW